MLYLQIIYKFIFFFSCFSINVQLPETAHNAGQATTCIFAGSTFRFVDTSCFFFFHEIVVQLLNVTEALFCNKRIETLFFRILFFNLCNNGSFCYQSTPRGFHFPHHNPTGDILCQSMESCARKWGAKKAFP